MMPLEATIFGFAGLATTNYRFAKYLDWRLRTWKLHEDFVDCVVYVVYTISAVLFGFSVYTLLLFIFNIR